MVPGVIPFPCRIACRASYLPKSGWFGGTELNCGDLARRASRQAAYMLSLPNGRGRPRPSAQRGIPLLAQGAWPHDRAPFSLWPWGGSCKDRGAALRREDGDTSVPAPR